MKLKLNNKENITDNIWAFRFEPSEKLGWAPGQFIQVEIPHDAPDEEGTKRWFTVSSAPYEGLIQITTRVTGTTFKQALAALPVGDTIDLLEAPDGDFVWQDSERTLVFVAGGIGITPYYSMLKQRYYEHKPLEVTLIYGGRTADLPFRAEFDQWAASDSRFKVHYVIGQPLTPEALMALQPQLNTSLVYLSGPEPMVEALGDQLKAAGLPEAQLKQDFFPNYTEANY